MIPETLYILVGGIDYSDMTTEYMKGDTLEELLEEARPVARAWAKRLGTSSAQIAKRNGIGGFAIIETVTI